MQNRRWVAVVAVSGMLLVSLVIGVALWRKSYQEELRQEEERRLLVEVILAKEDKPAGTYVTLDWLVKEKRHRVDLDDDVVLADHVREIVGQRIAVRKGKGAPMRWSDFGCGGH